MSIDGQRIDPARYALIPRTLSFLIRGNQVLLLELGTRRAEWAGLYNGIGGHIEQGEDALSAAIREVKEETGLHVPTQRLCGIAMIDPGDNPGISLHVFVGELRSDATPAAQDDRPTWIPLDRLDEYPLVEDLPTILPAALRAYQERSLFHASYSYGVSGKPQIAINQ
jgi:8-oxo-dGTP diphosphatase